MDKMQIIEEIRRLAKTNKGQAPGSRMLESKTGIKKSDWYPHHWLRWGDALVEAGLTPNQKNTAINSDVAITNLVAFIRQLGRFPVEGEIRLRSKQDPSFPSHSTFRKLGGKSKLAQAVVNYCRSHGDLQDVIDACAGRIVDDVVTPTSDADSGPENSDGFVYLMKSGRYFKIGRTDAVGRRQREINIQLPEETETVHYIRTDDPSGIEAYWHRRFAAKRLKGEWFDLTRADVKAFKRRKQFM